MKCIVNAVLIAVFLLLLTNKALAQQSTSQYKQTIVIKSARKYNGASIESIIPSNEPKGLVVKTKDGKGYFLKPEEAKEKLDITFTEKGFVLPKDASATYYDANGVPSDGYQKGDYTQNERRIHPLSMQFASIASDSLKKPLYFLNGKEISKEEMDGLNPNDIEKVDVLSGDKAGSIYGERAKDGAVVITLKEGSLRDTTAHPVDVAATFPGGMLAWRRYIEKNIRYPRAAQQARIMGKVRVKITVAKDGSLSAEPITKFGYGLEDEAIRLVKESPKWSIATRDGVPVTYTFNQSVSFFMQ